MSFYEILGVDKYSSDEEIKLAYGGLVEKFNLDKNPTEEAKAVIQKINEAYEVLLDPVKRWQYDQTIITPIEEVVNEEDPQEIYRREYIRKKNLEAKAEDEENERKMNRIFSILRIANFLILPVALILIIDSLLPYKTYKEHATLGWQKRSGGGKYSRGKLMSFMQTANFVMAVPDELHLNYDYYENPEPLYIDATMIFKVPRSVGILRGDTFLYSSVYHPVYLGIVFVYIMFICALAVILRRSYAPQLLALSVASLFMSAVVVGEMFLFGK